MSKPHQLPIRLDHATYAMLQLCAKQTGRSMNKLAKEAIEARLRIIASELEQDLRTTLAQVQRYSKSTSALDADLEAFAVAEAECEDPTEATRVQFGDEHAGGSTDPPTAQAMTALEADVEVILGGT